MLGLCRLPLRGVNISFQLPVLHYAILLSFCEDSDLFTVSQCRECKFALRTWKVSEVANLIEAHA
jgi:hypothetical protein